MLKVWKVIWSRSNIYVPGLIVHLGGTALRPAAVSPQKIFFLWNVSSNKLLRGKVRKTERLQTMHVHCTVRKQPYNTFWKESS